MHPLAPVTALAIVAIGLGAVIAHQQPITAVSGTGPVDVGGLQYAVGGARPLDEIGDAPVIRALPRSQPHASRQGVLYGVFVTVDNRGPRAWPMARRFALIDADEHSFTPIPLRRDSAFAYRARSLPGWQLAPATGSAPADDYAEEGYPLVFRIPSANARDGLLTLRVFDPTGSAPGDTVVQAA
jgi:hypothetical protein